MIELTTGLPGNGKTLYTISNIKQRAETEGRQVYYHGIPELSLDWVQIEDPTKWMDVPPNSIVVIDEAQKTFRNRSLGQIPPKHVTDLETHRHLGIDLVLLTQHPSLIDPAVRRLAGRHQHMVRIFGMEASTVYRWESVTDNCDKPASRKNAESKKWAFDKSVYKLYKSAEVHTMKRSIPSSVKWLVALPVVMALCGFFAYKVLWRVSEVPGANKAVAAAAPATGGIAGPAAAFQSSTAAGGIGGGSSKVPDALEDAKEYLFNQTPRIVGLPQTAPKYDPLTVPTRVPVPAACIQVGSVASKKEITCKCYSQQGTPMAVEFNMCIEFARNGFFQDFDADRDRQQVARSEAGLQVMSNRPEASIPVREVQDGPRVSVLPGTPMGVARTEKSGPLQGSIVEDGPPNNRATRAAAGEKVAGL